MQGQQKAADILEKMNATKQKIQENADERAFNLQMDAIDKNIETEQNRYEAEKEEREKQRTDTLAFYEQQKKDAEQKFLKIEEENKKHFERLNEQITAYNTGSITSLNAGQDGILKMLEGKATGYFDTGKKIGESFKTGIESALNAAQTAATEKMKQVNAMMNPLVQTLSGGNNAMNSVGGYQSGQAGLGFVGASFGSIVTVQNMNVNNGTDSKVVAYDIANTANARLRSFGVKG